MNRAARPGLAQGLRDRLGTDPAIAVPLGLAVPQSHAVDHARAQEPVVVRVVQAQRIGAVAQVAPAEFGGQAAGDRQVECGGLCADRREGALEEAIRVGHGGPFACRGRPARVLNQFFRAGPGWPSAK